MQDERDPASQRTAVEPRDEFAGLTMAGGVAGGDRRGASRPADHRPAGHLGQGTSPTTGAGLSARIEFLDFAKGFAILGIVLYHYLSSSTSGFFQWGTQLGGAGVHLFLLLAGFGLSIARPPVSWAAFYKRRFVRVLVPYYLVMTALLLVNSFRPYFPGDGLYAYAGHILLFKMFDERIFMSFGSVFWFMSVLIALYLIFPLLVMAQNRLGNVRFALAAGGVSVGYLLVIGALDAADVQVARNFFVAYLWEFCLGMVLGRSYRESGFQFWDQPTAVLAAVSVAALGAMAALATLGGNFGRLFNDAPALVGYAALAALVYSLAKKMSSRVVALVGFLGLISLELYLVHIVVWRAVTQDVVPHLTGAALVVESLLVIPVAVIVAVALRGVTGRLIPGRPRLESPGYPQCPPKEAQVNP